MRFCDILNDVSENAEFINCFNAQLKEAGFTYQFDDVKMLFNNYISDEAIANKLDIFVKLIEDRMTKAKPINDVIGLDDITKKTFAEVFTPPKLIDDMLDKLPEEVWSNPDFKWIDNSCGTGIFLWHGLIPRLNKGLQTIIPDPHERKKHIAGMIHGVDIQPTNVGIARGYLIKALGSSNLETIKRNIACANSLEFDYWQGKKFDVMVGNPPYQDPTKTGKLGGKEPLWIRFVNKALKELIREDGYLVYVHPALWRQAGDKKCSILREKNMIFLSINNEKSGLKTFGAETRYDWYVLQNNSNYIETIVCGEDAMKSKINLQDWDFVPNMMFDEIKNLIATQKNNQVQIIHSYSSYETRKTWMSKTQTSQHKYPCVYMNGKNGMTFFYSSLNKGHFGETKVIIPPGRISSVNVIEDKEGIYGLTQFCWGIKCEKDEVVAMANALNSQQFKKIAYACSVSKLEYNKAIIGTFRKDFWKEFITVE
jgi:hypothetical protein